MKTLFILITILAGANVSVFMSTKSSDNNISLATVETIENLCDNEDGCLNGGPGSSSCSIGGGIGVRGIGAAQAGIDYNCSVDCKEGYYACCGIRCKCIREDSAAAHIQIKTLQYLSK